MSTILTSPFLFVVVCYVLGGCAASERGMSARQALAVAHDVSETLDAYVDRLNAADWDSVTRFYRGDTLFAWAEDGFVRYESVAEVRSAYAQLARFGGGTTSISDVRIVPLTPSVASVMAGFEQSFPSGEGQDFSFRGIISLSAVSTSSGWKFVFGHSSTRRPRA